MVAVSFWLTWLGSSIAVGFALRHVDALWLPVVAFLVLMSYAGLWPDKITNGLWFFALLFEVVISATFVGLGVVVGRRQASKRSRP